LDKLFAGVQVSDLLVTPLLMGPVSLISQGRFEESIRGCPSLNSPQCNLFNAVTD